LEADAQIVSTGEALMERRLAEIPPEEWNDVRVDITPRESTLCGAPHNVDIGAAWSKRSNEGREYLGLKLDDPSFTAPIFANLFDDEDGEGYSLIWSRPNNRRGD
jgi:uncharacterized protein (DUF736 family)